MIFLQIVGPSFHTRIKQEVTL